MIIRDCYRILGVSPNAPLAEVRQRYRSLARQHHPDHHPDDPEAAIRFRQVAEAYQTIQQARSRSRTACQNLRRPRFPDDDELLQEFFGISGGSARLRQSAGADFRYDLQISLAAALRGTQAVIQVDRAFNCRHCQGTGLAPGGSYASCPACRGRGRSHCGPGLLRFGPRCPRCGGSGKVIAQACDHCHGQGATMGKREYRLRLPPGIPHGARLRLDGEGGQGFQNGPPGNLEVVIHVAPDDFFTRIGNDIHCQVRVSCAKAARGGVILVPTLDGYRAVELPQGAQSGWVFRFPGAGAPGGPGRLPGDQVMEIVVNAADDFKIRQNQRFAELSRLGSEARTGAGYE
ncbi:MAG: DnaJ C-terminal domain-containing protein [Desulfobaccales bacterium]